MQPETKKFRLQLLTGIILGTLLAMVLGYIAVLMFRADNWMHPVAFLMVIGLVLGLVEIRRLNIRLADLARIADSLGRGNYNTRAEVLGADSVSLVGQGLNLMAERVAESIAEIRTSRDDLANSQIELKEQHEKLTQAYERQARFGDFLSKLQSIDVDTLAQDAFAALMEAANAQIGVLYLFDQRAQQLKLIAERGIDQEAMRKLAPENTFDGLPGETFNRREWIQIDNLDADSLPAINLGFTSARIRSVYSIPLLFQNKALGVLILAGLQKSDGVTVQVLRNYTSALANALSNAQTYMTVQQQSAQVEKANNRLMDIDLHRRQFVANMSHELRTPLNSIIGFSGVLLKNREGNLTDKDLDRAEKINRNGKHLLKLINDILDLSKMEADRMETSMRSTDLKAIVTDVSDLLDPQVSAKHIEMCLDFPDEPVAIETDPDKLRQILINLASNAVKFTDEGAVTIRLLPPNDESRVVIEVADTGIGIDNEKLETIFEAFQQADNSTSRKYGGTGLGLTISRTLLTLLGGRIHVSSKLGEGSCFRIELPVNSKIPQSQLPLDADDILFPEESARMLEEKA